MLRAAGYALCVLVALVLWPQTLGGRVAYVMVSGQSMEPTMHAHDVAMVVRRGGYEIGDVIAFRVPEGEVGEGSEVIHRIVGGSARAGYITRGDNNDYDDPWQPTERDIVGERIATLPQAGSLFARLQGPLPLAAFAAVVAVMAAVPSRSRGSISRRARVSGA